MIEAEAGRGAVLGFCVAADGGLVAVTGLAEPFGAGPNRPRDDDRPPHRLVWFAADGGEARSVDLDFAASVVAARPDGGFCVAGDGVVSLVTAEGREVTRTTTPHLPKTDEELAELERAATERRDAQLAGFEHQIERRREAIAEIEEREKEERQKAEREAADAEDAAGEIASGSDDADDTDDAEARRLAREQETRLKSARSQARALATQLRQFETMAENLRRQDPAQLVEQSLRKARQVRAISAAADAVFIVTAETSGYGYAAWRLDARLENAEKVLAKLTGCCGQMDVQVIGGRLAVSQNRKHCVELVSFAGETVATVGCRASGAEPSGFGGCCNPMNTCAAPEGGLLTNESNGVVKRFDADGSLVGIVCRAGVKGGCKNSAIAIEPDGSRLYYLDSAGGKVLVLTKAEGRDVPRADETADLAE